MSEMKQLGHAAATLLRFAKKTGAALITMKGEDGDGVQVLAIVVATGANAPPIVEAADALKDEDEDEPEQAAG